MISNIHINQPNSRKNKKIVKYTNKVISLATVEINQVSVSFNVAPYIITQVGEKVHNFLMKLQIKVIKSIKAHLLKQKQAKFKQNQLPQ